MKKVVTLTVVLSASLLFTNSVLTSEAAEPAAPANGAAIYNQNCVKCHGVGGKGVENFTPDLSKTPGTSSWLSVIKNGKGAMPGFKDSLSASQVNAVFSHVRSFAAKGKKKK